MNINITGDSGATAGRDINIDKVVINQAEAAPEWVHEQAAQPAAKYSPETTALFKLCLLEYARHANGNGDYFELSPAELREMGEFRQLLENLVDTAKRNAREGRCAN